MQNTQKKIFFICLQILFKKKQTKLEEIKKFQKDFMEEKIPKNEYEERLKILQKEADECIF